MNVRGQTNKQWMVETLRLVLREAEVQWRMVEEDGYPGSLVPDGGFVTAATLAEVRAVLAEVDRPKRPKE